MLSDRGSIPLSSTTVRNPNLNRFGFLVFSGAAAEKRRSFQMLMQRSEHGADVQGLGDVAVHAAL